MPTDRLPEFPIHDDANADARAAERPAPDVAAPVAMPPAVPRPINLEPLVLRWIATPLAAFAASIASFVAVVLVAATCERAVPGLDLGTLIPAEPGIGILYAVCAFAAVAAASATAPTGRRVVALATFACGTWLAWTVVAHPPHRANEPGVPELALVPFAITEAGGVAGVLAVWFWRPLRRTWRTRAATARRREA